jgi:ABC-type uncharacterized transport system fused permease/ATPase subunit
MLHCSCRNLCALACCVIVVVVVARSGGEQQRLGFARLLYQRPMFALLDESTSAMDSALEEHCMRAATAAGITCVSVGHRPTLRAFHASCLTLDGAGGAFLTVLQS